MPERLVKGYTLKMVAPDCFPGAGWWRAHAELEEDISGVLPYLNAELEGCRYDPGADTLIWSGGNARFALRPRDIAVAPVESNEQARSLIDEIIETVNETWGRRSEIEPDFRGNKPLPSVLEIFKALPGTNCRECGYATCMAFAAALRSGETEPSECPYFSERAFEELTSPEP